jgi:hypothetical protein
MRLQGAQLEEGSIAHLIGRMAEGLGTLVTDHLTLAKLELVGDAKAVGGEVGKLAAFVPFVVVGYGLLCASAAAALAPTLGLAGALLAVGGANLVAGGFGIARAVSRLKGRPMLSESLNEINRSASVLAAPAQAAMTEAPRGQR